MQRKIQHENRDREKNDESIKDGKREMKENMEQKLRQRRIRKHFGQKLIMLHAYMTFPPRDNLCAMQFELGTPM